jgi:hypothetical protein
MAQRTRNGLVINIKTTETLVLTETLGLTVPPSLLGLADEVSE